ncbi:MAG: YhcH/YjgK/YiaL family protein [Flavobacteriales bacterium]|nr:YhcH/YjgK/YiaL family protein [Flavobacteriales bacterium]
MILDNIENIKLYSGINERINKAFEYIKSTDFSLLDNGTYDVVEGEIFAIVNRYETIHESKEQLECHRKYIDVQYIFEGEELLAYLNKTVQIPSQVYSDNDDFELYNENRDFLKFKSGMFCVLFPDDLHAFGIHEKTSTKVSKVVVKVLV